MTTAPAEIIAPASGNRPLRPYTRPSLRGAINAKCKECIYDPRSGMGTWREQVTACTSYSCPLFAVRPVSEGVK